MKKNFEALKRVIFQLYRIMTVEQRQKSIIVFLSMLVVSFLELIGVSSIYPFIQLLLSDGNSESNGIISIINHIIPSASRKDVFVLLSLIIIIVFVFKNSMSLLCTYIQQKYVSSFQRDLTVLMLKSYMKRSYEFFVNTNSSILQRGIAGDTSSVNATLLNLFQLAGEVITVTMLAAYLIRTDYVIAILVLSVAACCAGMTILLFKNRIKMAGKLNREATKERNRWSYQAMDGIKEIIVLDRQEHFVTEYAKAADKTALASLTYGFLNACPDRILEGVCVAGIFTVVCIRIVLGADNASFIPTLGAFAVGAFRILPSFSKISSRINDIVYHQPGLESCYTNISEVRDYQKYRSSIDSAEELDKKSDNEKYVFNDTLKIDNITWKYTNSDKNVLENASLVIHRGESVALIGESGAGKTTLADIIMGLFVPQEGDITIDGNSIFANRHKWSHTVGYVPQAAFLIDDTIRANVAFGIEKDRIDDFAVWKALEDASLADFVKNLPDGINTIVGERGVKFSGGQRQRISIARALYNNPDILILDEATSALDNETEAAVMESIDALKGQKTLIIIAHRITTIRRCDKIFEVIDKSIIERDKEKVLDFSS